MFLFAISFSILASDHTTADLTLTQKQLNDFFTNGIVIIPGFFSQQEVAQALESATRLQNEAEKLAEQHTGRIMYHGTQIVIDKVGDKNEIIRIVWAGAAEPQLLELSRQRKLLIPVSQILDSDKADQLNNQLHYKFPNGSAVTTYYQDIRARKVFDADWQDLNGKGSFVMAVIALDSLNASDGTIYYVPQSHTRGDLMLDKMQDKTEMLVFGDLARDKTNDKSKLYMVAQLDRAVPLELEPGDLVLWHPYLIHGSDPNRFTTPRRIFLNGFAYPGANSKPYPGEGSAQQINLK